MDAVILRELSSALIAVSSPPTAPGWNHTLIARLSGDRPQRPAAVLVGLRQGRQPKLIFTVRTGDVATHVGEVAFPGGACDASDTDALATALRESGEEIGLDRRLVSPCGYLECFETLSGFCITPVVAWVNAQARLQPSPREVAEIFEVPLAFFLEPENMRHYRASYHGVHYEMVEFYYGGHRIWGATAAMVCNLLARLGRLSCRVLSC